MWPPFFSAPTEALILVGRYRKRRRRLEVWQGVAAASGLRVVESPSLRARPQVLKALAGPVEVRFEDSRRYGTRVVVVVPGPPGFSDVTIHREPGQPSGPPVEVGDVLFDRAFYVLGPVPLVCAMLDAEVRGLLWRLSAECRLEIAGGELRAEMRETHVASLLPLLLDLGQRLAQHVDPPRCLAENARRDPDAGARLRNLLVLAREFPGAAETVEALRTACSDPKPEIRLRAAQGLGAEGRDALLELAQSELDDTWNAQAVSILGRRLPFDLTSGILTHALRRRRTLTARACLESLGRSGDPAAVATLANVMAREQGELATAAALALGKAGSTAAEPPLILALQQKNTDVMAAAATALGQVGTAEAVLPLKKATERTSFHPALHRAIRQAIAEIQFRLPGASPGQLSLAAAEAGQLSLAPAEAGQLSLATDPAGQLSLPSGEADRVCGE